MRPLDLISEELAVSTVPRDADSYALGRGIALLSLACASLVARYTDLMEPVSETLSDEDRERAGVDVTIFLDLAHHYSMDAGPRDLTNDDMQRIKDTLDEWSEDNDH